MWSRRFGSVRTPCSGAVGARKPIIGSQPSLSAEGHPVAKSTTSSPHGAPRSANEMNTNDDDADLERVEFDFSRAKLVNRPSSSDGFGVVIDGAVEYSLRLIPSNKILGRFASTREAWPAVLAEIERGIPAKCLVLDWHWANGRRGRVSSGRLLVSTARSGLGLDGAPRRMRAAS